MIRLLRPGKATRNQDDILRLLGALNKLGYHAHFSDIEWAWEQYSESMAAGWMSLMDSDYDNAQIVLGYLEVE